MRRRPLSSKNHTDVAPADPSDTHAYRQPIEAVLQAVGAHPRRGLAGDDARRRLERDGPNELAAEKRIPAWRKFLAQFQDVLVILLLVATAISTAVCGLRARRAAAVRGDRDPARSCSSTPSWAISRSRAPSRRSQRCGVMAAAQARVLRDGELRQHPRHRRRARRHPPGRRRRHDPGRRAGDPVDRAADGGGRAHGREPAGLQRHRAASRTKRRSAIATT